MKVRLLPLAIAAAIAAPGVALADGPTVYGKLNVSYEMVDVDYAYPVTGDRSNSADRWELISNLSRLGVKGDAKINDGLKAIYQAEFGIDADEGVSSGSGNTAQVFSQRDIFVGLSGGFGSFTAGKFDSPLRKSQGKVDQFNDLSGDLQYLFIGENRPSNILQYSSPQMGGLQVNFAFMPGEEYDDGLNATSTPVDPDRPDERDGPADSFSTSVTFNSDMIYAALAYDSEVSSTANLGLVHPSYAFDTDTALFDTLRLTGVFTLDALQLGVMYQMAETSDADYDGDLEQDGFLLSASYKLGQVVLKAQYGTSTFSNNDTNEDWDAEQIAFGADYLLSKQTTVFGYVNLLSYEEDTTGGEKQTKDNIGVGIVHNF